MTLYLVRPAHGWKRHERINLDLVPCPTILASGDPGAFAYYLEDDGKSSIPQMINKLPYAVPSMAEIRAIPWNGYSVVSTFSGCGGSCLGYRMAGYRVLWASEFVPIAGASYQRNHPESVLDTRDIHQVSVEEILQAIQMKSGEIDLLDGSPPCQAFSTAGVREKGWGKAKQYEHGARQCNEQLFDEYIRLLQGLQPKTFVAENVSGLVKGTAKGYFKRILSGLKASGYIVEARLLDAQWLGVPQARQRIIFIGVREDLSLKPVFPKPLPYRYSVRDALPWIVRQGNKVEAVIHDTGNFASKVPITDKPCPTITNGAGAANSTHYLIVGKGDRDTATRRQPDHIERRKFSIAELKRICAFPDDFQLVGTYAQQWACLGNSVPPVMMRAIAEVIREEILGKLRSVESV